MQTEKMKNIVCREMDGETFPEATNKVLLKGILEEDFIDVEGKYKYKSAIRIKRLSNVEDVIPIFTSSKIFMQQFHKGDAVEIIGYLQSEHYLGQDSKKHLRCFVVGKRIFACNPGENVNEVYLEGYIPPTTPTFRITRNCRVISDVSLINNMSRNRTAYLMCIAWGGNARLAMKLKQGKKLRLVGRIQSREFLKENENSELEVQTVYEVSITEFEPTA